MRRLRRSRLIKIAAALMIFACGIFLLLSALGPVLGPRLYLLAGYLEGQPKHCTHNLNDNRRVRLTYTPYARRAQGDGHQVDPNNWENEPMAHDYTFFLTIIIPAFDYEISQDGGKSWGTFWHYENQLNTYPDCSAFGSMDADNFWFWLRDQVLITHDGGANWIIEDGSQTWNSSDNLFIQTVNFDTPQNGRIVFWQAMPNLITDDGGKTWHPDPNWATPTPTGQG
jgi:hypothetical protein